jgi:hypothetical protein
LKDSDSNITVATFFDPLIAGDKDESKKDLRLQVQDFIEWLKSQGIIQLGVMV